MLAPLLDLLSNAARALRNLAARLLPRADYVLLTASGTLPERRPPARGLLQRLLPQPLGLPVQESLEEWRERLRWLARDPRVRGIVLKVDDLRAGQASVAGLRAALQQFRASGKRVVAYLASASLLGYYLASAADEVVVPESAELMLTGQRTELTFLRIALDRLGILPQFHHIAEYKTASHRFLYPASTAPQREMVRALVEDMYGDLVRGIAEGRGMPEAEARRALDEGILAGAAAAARGLATAVAFDDELPARLGAGGRPARILPWPQARTRVRLPYRWRTMERRAVAVVQLIGAIVPGESRELPVPFPLLGSAPGRHESVVRALRTAAGLPAVKAVVFHVDSGGGSAVASDLIWREVLRVQQRKPVVVHMGNVAGSGGYYVACGAKHIVAGPATITGSIGVVSGKFNMRGLLERLGMRREIVGEGATAAMFSAFTDFTEEEWALLRGWMQDVYARFTARVAAGRRMEPARVEALARGRVYTGRQALEVGLVDELGDFEAAVRRARALAGIPEAADVPVVTIRPPRGAAIPEGVPAAWMEGLRQAARLYQERVLLLAPLDAGLIP